MKPLFVKKNGTVSKVSGIVMNLIPSYTLAEYNALTHKPLFWVRTDEEYAQISSENVSYGNSTVKEELDEINAEITKEYTEIMSKTATGTYTVDITGKTEFIYGRKNPNGTLNNYNYAHISMFGLSNGLEIATTGSIVADLTISGNVLTAYVATLSSGSFVVFAR